MNIKKYIITYVVNIMFHVKLNAGLGNRLFQYASIKGFANKLNMGVHIMEVENTFHDTHNSYKWFYDKIVNDINTQHIVNIDYEYNQPYQEHIGYNTEVDIFKNYKNIKIHGYFQYEHNFLHIKDELQYMFRESEDVKNLLDKYEESLPFKYKDATVLHIRLGDFINFPKHFVNLENYYKTCIDILYEKNKNINKDLNIIILCEDPQNIRHIYSSLLQYIISNNINGIIKEQNNNHSVEFDLYLMTRCKNIICSNSTFAWWGAWLNTYPEKEVFIPNKWLNDRPYIVSMEGATIIDI